MTHFNWTQLIHGVEHHHIHIATGVLTTLLITILSIVGFVSIKATKGNPAPSGKFNVRGVFEFITEFIVGLVDTVIGKHGRIFVPFFCALFTYILLNNLVGLVPGMTPATDNINTTAAIGLVSFILYNFLGIKEHGVVSYLKHFMGPIIWLAPLMLVIELISHLVRPLSLGMRLAGNMTGDHTVLGVFLDLVPAWMPVPVIFYGLGLFVCLVQAFVFTLLSMVYVSMAVAHDH
ncbi:MAG: F0F1 ATP synthase subunit A [Bdellovibrionales bacterium]|nr:F0F1 ATP synthase subunit A [Bdellovibrionales bacterium]